MNYKKLALIASGISLFAASLVPLSASALSTATMTLSGSSNNNGNFAVTVYENTGADTVTGANVVLAFSSAVSNVSYDYTVGPFVATTPSGAHNAYGTVTGQQPVATVHFTVNSPATVTATIDAASYLKHVDGTTISNFVITRGSADFTYTAPATQPSNTGSGSSTGTSSTTPKNGGTSSTKTGTGSTSTNTSGTGSTSTGTSTSTTGTTSNTGSTSNKSNQQNKYNAPQHRRFTSRHAAAVSTSLIAVLVVALGYLLVLRKRPELAPAKMYKLYATNAAAKKSASSKKVPVKKNGKKA